MRAAGAQLAEYKSPLGGLTVRQWDGSHTVGVNAALSEVRTNDTLLDWWLEIFEPDDTTTVSVPPIRRDLVSLADA